MPFHREIELESAIPGSAWYNIHEVASPTGGVVPAVVLNPSLPQGAKQRRFTRRGPEAGVFNHCGNAQICRFHQCSFT